MTDMKAIDSLDWEEKKYQRMGWSKKITKKKMTRDGTPGSECGSVPMRDDPGHML